MIIIASPPIKIHFSRPVKGLVTTLGGGGSTVAAKVVPQLLQKSASGGLSCPQLLHRTGAAGEDGSTVASKVAPQLAQKPASGGLSSPQLKHRTYTLHPVYSLYLRKTL